MIIGHKREIKGGVQWKLRRADIVALVKRPLILPYIFFLSCFVAWILF